MTVTVHAHTHKNTPTQHPSSSGREGALDLQEFEDENDAVWRNPTVGGPAVLRGKTAGDRRQVCSDFIHKKCVGQKL